MRAHSHQLQGTQLPSQEVLALRHLLRLSVNCHLQLDLKWLMVKNLLKGKLVCVHTDVQITVGVSLSGSGILCSLGYVPRVWNHLESFRNFQTIRLSTSSLPQKDLSDQHLHSNIVGGGSMRSSKTAERSGGSAVVGRGKSVLFGSGVLSGKLTWVLIFLLL